MTTKHILLVEHYEALAAVVTRILEEAEGYSVTAAPSLQEAVEILQSSHFDLVITAAFDQKDLYKFDPAFLYELKLVSNGTPIILCSTYACGYNINSASLGLADVVPKPFDVDELLQKINKALATNSDPLLASEAA